jgi:hypothetical protein
MAGIAKWQVNRSSKKWMAPPVGFYPTAFSRYESKPTVSACLRLNNNSFFPIGTSVEVYVMITRLVRTCGLLGQ